MAPVEGLQAGQYATRRMADFPIVVISTHRHSRTPIVELVQKSLRNLDRNARAALNRVASGVDEMTRWGIYLVMMLPTLWHGWRGGCDARMGKRGRGLEELASE